MTISRCSPGSSHTGLRPRGLGTATPSTPTPSRRLFHLLLTYMPDIYTEQAAGHTVQRRQATRQEAG